jgi:hypothetical protein
MEMNEDLKRGREVNRRLMEEVRADALNRQAWNRSRATNLYVDTATVNGDQVINAGHQTIEVKRDSIVVFADDAPLYNWSHPCRYLMYDARNGDMYREVHATFPPYLADAPSSFKAFNRPVTFPVPDMFRVAWPERRDLSKRLGKLTLYRRGKRYAVLFSGASNNRHVNDLEFLYRTLIGVYGFDPDNIYTLNYDGTVAYSGGPQPPSTWPGDGTPYEMVVKGQGTKSDLAATFDDLKSRLRSEDLLLVHTNNHGGHNGESYLCMHSGPSYGASDFADKLSELPRIAHLMIMMEQCHSGGFLDPVLAASPADETSICAACEEMRSSIGGAEFDPFARDWIGAMAGAGAYGAPLPSNPDVNADGVTGSTEAFDFAESVAHSYDTPVYAETPSGSGMDMHLGWPSPIMVLDWIRRYLEIYELGKVRPIPIPGPLPDPDPIFREITERLHTVRAMAGPPPTEVPSLTPTLGPRPEVTEAMASLEGPDGMRSMKALAELREPFNRIASILESFEFEETAKTQM